MKNEKQQLNTVKNKQNQNNARKVKYSFLTFVLILCIIELSISSFSNINKHINFISKIKGLENKRNEELDKNRQLKSEIENFNPELTLQSIARNNLKMAEKNEILLIMEEPKDREADEAVTSN